MDTQGERLMPANRFDQLIDAWDPKLRDAFLSSVRAIRSRAQIRVLADLLERGDVDGALRSLGLDPIAFRALDAQIAAAFEDGGRYTVETIPALKEPSGFRLAIRFDVRNIAAETWLRQHSAALITSIVDDQRSLVRQALTFGMEAGRNPRSVALDLVGRIGASGNREGGIIGLTASQEAWVRAYAAELDALDPNALKRELRDKRFDRTIAKAIREGTPISAETKAKMIAAYRNRALRYRAETIGRTEAMTALHQSQVEAFRQAIAAGQVDQATVVKVWHSAGDNRVRHTHRVLNKQEVGFDAKFVSPSGAQLAFPGDPAAPRAEIVNCRCWMDTKIDFLAGVT